MGKSQSHVEEKEERSAKEKNLAASIAFLRDKLKSILLALLLLSFCWSINKNQWFKYTFDSQRFKVKYL